MAFGFGSSEYREVKSPKIGKMEAFEIRGCRFNVYDSGAEKYFLNGIFPDFPGSTWIMSLWMPRRKDESEKSEAQYQKSLSHFLKFIEVLGLKIEKGSDEYDLADQMIEKVFESIVFVDEKNQFSPNLTRAKASNRTKKTKAVFNKSTEDDVFG